MGIEYYQEGTPLEQVNALRKCLKQYNYTLGDPTNMGVLFGVANLQLYSMGEFKKLLEQLEKSITAQDQDSRSAREFINSLNDDLNAFELHLQHTITKMPKIKTIKEDTRAGIVTTPTIQKLIQTESIMISQFESIQHALAGTVDTLNEAFEADIKTRDARIELAVALLKVGLGVAGAAGIGDVVDQAIKVMHPEDVEVLTGAAGEISRHAVERHMADVFAEEVINTAGDLALIHAAQGVKSASSIISADFQRDMTKLISLIKAYSHATIIRNIERINNTFMSEEKWSGDFNHVLKGNLEHMNPNNLDAILLETQIQMQKRVRDIREHLAQHTYNHLPRPIRKLAEFGEIKPNDHFEKAYNEKMLPITEYFQLHFLTAVLAREFLRSDAQQYNYQSTESTEGESSVHHKGYELMTRGKEIRYLPHMLKEMPDVLILLEPHVKTGPKHFDKSIHKGGRKIRQFLISQIRGIHENMKLYGFKSDGSGKIKSKGTVEDMLRSYTVIIKLMDATSKHEDVDSSMPIFKTTGELFDVIMRLMRINIFFIPHAENNGKLLVTPLTIFNRDPHFKDLIGQDHHLQTQLIKLVTDTQFVLKCLTDPNSTGSTADNKRLLATRDEIVTLLEFLKKISKKEVAVSELLERTKEYINLQCQKPAFIEQIRKSISIARILREELFQSGINIKRSIRMQLQQALDYQEQKDINFVITYLSDMLPRYEQNSPQYRVIIRLVSTLTVIRDLKNQLAQLTEIQEGLQERDLFSSYSHAASSSPSETDSALATSSNSLSDLHTASPISSNADSLISSSSSLSSEQKQSELRAAPLSDEEKLIDTEEDSSTASQSSSSNTRNASATTLSVEERPKAEAHRSPLRANSLLVQTKKGAAPAASQNDEQQQITSPSPIKITDV